MALTENFFNHTDEAAALPDFLMTEMRSAACTGTVGHGGPELIGSSPVLPILEDLDGRKVDLAGYGLGGPLVLFFHCGRDCARCGKLSAALRATAADIRLAGAKTAVIVAKLTELSLADLMPEAPLLVDRQSWFARRLGLADGVPENRNPEAGATRTAILVLDGTGVIRWAARGGQIAVRDITAAVQRMMPLGHRV